MTNNIAKIRAALECAKSAARFCALPGLDRETDEALAALAELERAASEPVTYQYSHPSGSGRIWRNEQRWNGHTSDEARALYAAPPAPIAEIREAVDVTRPMCHGAWALFWSEPNTGDSCDQARRWLEAWRAELGPALGLVEIREPTVGECERIDSMYASLDRTSHGRAMFDAVRAVMWPKSEAK